MVLEMVITKHCSGQAAECGVSGQEKMTFHHVIAKVGAQDKFRCLFVDLSSEALHERFIKPYEKGQSFFSGNDLIAPNDLKSIRIIQTMRPDQVERDEINRKDREHIDELNRSSDGVFIVSVGGGYAAQDIAEVGKDLTHDLIKGPPGYKQNQWALSHKAFGWIFGIVASVLAAGLAKWLGWL